VVANAIQHGDGTPVEVQIRKDGAAAERIEEPAEDTRRDG